MAKPKCATCAFRSTDIAPNKEILSFCMFHPPRAMFMQTSNGAAAVNAPRPTVRPERDYCSAWLEEASLNPH